jgi:hypothetical protein
MKSRFAPGGALMLGPLYSWAIFQPGVLPEAHGGPGPMAPRRASPKPKIAEA